jgi:uncharacterized OsmC-like protein/alpha/beta superfamily hydrolase
MPSARFEFPNAKGEKLAALLDSPLGEPRAYALFAHCFTCGKDVHAAKRIAEALKAHGVAVLRFDFTGLGSSEGEFANTTFSSNIADLIAASDHLRATRRAPEILIGHSLGGAAVLAAAERVPEARAVVTIGAPADPSHVTGLFADDVDDIRARGDVEVKLAGRPFRIRREFIDDLNEQNLKEHLSKLRRALLIFHAPTDQIVGIENAADIYTAAKHPKSFISLPGADHFLSKPIDAAYVADVLAAWAGRYIEGRPAGQQLAKGEQGIVTVAETRRNQLQQEIVIGPHRLLADEPVNAGGAGTGPNPYDLLLAGLGACTSMTLRLYADFKKLPLERVSVRMSHRKIYATDCEECETKEGKLDRIEREIELTGELDETQRARLLEIADRCPVHRTLHSEISIHTTERKPTT